MRIEGLTLAAGLLMATVTGCSSEPAQSEPPPGALTAGTAVITVNDKHLGEFHSVACHTTGPLTTISTGEQEAGATALVSNADGLTAESVSIRNLGAFTGSYNRGLGGQAEVTMTGKTYAITGIADGFDTEAPSFRRTGRFTIEVAC